MNPRPSIRLATTCLLFALAFSTGRSPRAHAEAEDQDPVQNGVAYARWQRVIAAHPDASGSAGAFVLACNYLGSFAQRESAWEVRIKMLSRSYGVPPGLARDLGLRKDQPLPAAVRSPRLDGVCPAPPEEQALDWSPRFMAPDSASKLGLQALPPTAALPAEREIPLNLSARAVSDSNSLCDDPQASLQALFSRRRPDHQRFCRNLVENEFDRGMKRCLGVVNSSLNRVFDKSFNARKMEPVVWSKDDPTQSYCSSLMTLAGQRFEALIGRAYSCSSAFQTLQTSSFDTERNALESVIRGVFASAAERVIPVLRKVHRDCKGGP